MPKKCQHTSYNKIPITQCHLYGIRSPHALAKRLGYNLKNLNDLAKDGNYRIFTIKNTNREIQEPGKKLQRLHKQLHRYLMRVKVPDYLHSSVKQRSYLTNAKSHIGKNPLIKIDIKKFYQSVPQYKVMHFFRDTLKCTSDVAGLLANLVCFKNKLATGSSVSPIISYYTYKELFDSIYQLAYNKKLVMTCYVDDITLSGANASNYVLHEIRRLIFRAGLKAHKARRYTENSTKIVTGIVVKKTKIDLPFVRWKKIRKQINTIKNSNNTNDINDLYSSLVSRLYEAAQITPKLRILAKKYHTEWKKNKSE